MAYLRHQWFDWIKGKENYRFLKELISSINITFIEPQGPSITVKSIKNIMSYLEVEFGLMKNLIQGRRLNFLLLNNSHTKWNGQCSTKHDVKGGLIFDLYLYHMKEKNISPEYVFLHELGHVVHTVLTRSCFAVPSNFVELLNLLLPGFVPEQDQLIEIFADFFAMCVMHNSVFAEYGNMFASVSEDHKQLSGYICR